MSSQSLVLIASILFFIGVNVVAIRYQIVAHRNLAPDAPSRAWVLFLGGLAKREYFTPFGWEMRRRSIWLNTLSIVPFILAMLFG